MNLSDEQRNLCLRIRQGPIELDLRDLLQIMAPAQHGMGLLQRLAQLEETLEAFGFQVLPEISDGNLESLRLISLKPAEPSHDNLLREIRREEDQHTEHKSSFACCIKTMRKMRDLPPTTFRKPEIEDSCLCAFAGMLNADGGVVIIGVEDDKQIVGLEPDFHALRAPNIDKWLLYVRAKIERWFHEGRSINPLIAFTFHEIDGKTIARASVKPRSRVALLYNQIQEKLPPRIIRRVGNQSPEVKAPDLEDFFEERFRSRRAL